MLGKAATQTPPTNDLSLWAKTVHAGPAHRDRRDEETKGRVSVESAWPMRIEGSAALSLGPSGANLAAASRPSSKIATARR